MNRRSDPAAAWPECIGQLKRTCRLAACETAGWQPALLRKRNWIVHHQRFEALFLRRSHLERLAVFLSAMLLSVFGARAHQPGMSTLAVQVRPEVVMVEITLSRVDAERLYPLDADKNGTVTPAEFDQAQAAMEELGITMVELSADGKLLPPDNPSVHLDESDAVHVDYQFATGSGSKLRLRSAVLWKLPPGHRQYLTIYDANRMMLGAWLLEQKHDSVDLPDVSGPHGFIAFLKLGIEHIVRGYDHLVFLLGLLIVGGRFAAAVKIITAFTVAHSITLALATLDLIRIPSALVEPLIAASIIYVGVENIFRRDLERRWMLAFVFGLIHGCGFATVLRELGVGSGGSSVVIPLLSFNLGVEAGQVVIACVVLPIIWKLKDRPSWQPRYVPACSVLIAIAGTYWLIDRLIGIVRS